MAKIIKAYKGGRTADFHIRIRPEVKRIIAQVAKEKKITMADVVEIVFSPGDILKVVDAKL